MAPSASPSRLHRLMNTVAGGACLVVPQLAQAAQVEHDDGAHRQQRQDEGGEDQGHHAPASGCQQPQRLRSRISSQEAGMPRLQ